MNDIIIYWIHNLSSWFSYGWVQLRRTSRTRSCVEYWVSSAFRRESANIFSESKYTFFGSLWPFRADLSVLCLKRDNSVIRECMRAPVLSFGNCWSSKKLNMWVLFFFLGIVLLRCTESITWVEEHTFIGRALTEQIMEFPLVVIPS